MSRISERVAQADDIEHEDVPVEKWGVTIRLKGMNGHGRSEYLTRLVAAREEEDDEKVATLEASLVVACSFDPEDDSKVFDESDIEMLLSKSGAILGVLSTKAQRLSGLDQAAEERLGKPSLTSETPGPDVTTPATTPSGDSSSASPAN